MTGLTLDANDASDKSKINVSFLLFHLNVSGKISLHAVFDVQRNLKVKMNLIVLSREFFR